MDISASTDYYDNGREDIAVFRPLTGIWHLMKATAGFIALQFGVSTETPTAFVYYFNL